MCQLRQKDKNEGYSESETGQFVVGVPSAKN